MPQEGKGEKRNKISELMQEILIKTKPTVEPALIFALMRNPKRMQSA